MTDILIRDVPAEDIERLDQRARDLGLSRNEFVRRELNQIARRYDGKITREDWRRAAYLARDLLDEEVMKGAWS